VDIIGTREQWDGTEIVYISNRQSGNKSLDDQSNRKLEERVYKI